MTRVALTNARPSAAHQWANGCTGAPRMRARYESAPSPEAAEGIRLHDLAAGCLTGATHLDELDLEDTPVVAKFVLDVEAEVAKASLGSRLLVERHLTWAEDARLQGTPDAALIDYERKHVILWDLKTGYGIVECVGNWQLLCYALMLYDPGWTYELKIVQTKVWHEDGHVRGWVPSRAVLESKLRHVREKFAEAMSPLGGVVRTGEHCRYCEALHACNAARSLTLSAVDWANREPADLSPDDMARELQTLQVTARLTKLRAEALETTIKALLKKGVHVPLVRFAPGKRGALRWLDESAARAAIIEATGKDPAVPKMRTPTQLIDSKFDEDLIKQHSRRGPASAKLVVDLTGEKAKSVFDAKPVDTSYIESNKAA